MTTLIDTIENEMSSDDENRGKQSDILRTTYEDADALVRQGIDACFVALCGWTLATLIDMSE